MQNLGESLGYFTPAFWEQTQPLPFLLTSASGQTPTVTISDAEHRTIKIVLRGIGVSRCTEHRILNCAAWHPNSECTEPIVLRGIRISNAIVLHDVRILFSNSDLVLRGLKSYCVAFCLCFDFLIYTKNLRNLLCSLFREKLIFAV